MTKTFKPSQWQLDLIKSLTNKDKPRAIILKGRWNEKRERIKALEKYFGIEVKELKPKKEPLLPDNYITFDEIHNYTEEEEKILRDSLLS